jgi:primosomal protein N' (replication factor Y)
VFAEVLVLQGTWPRAGRIPGEDTGRSRSLFTYMVPKALQETVRPGLLVAVPFGKQLVTGIIWSVTTSAPAFNIGRQLRWLHQILDITPILLPHQLELAEWLASYYSCSLASATRLFLPPNLIQREHVRLYLSGEPTAADAMGPAEQAILGMLRSCGRLDLSTIERALGKHHAHAAVAALVAAGIVEQQIELRLPRRRSDLVRLPHLAQERTLASINTASGNDDDSTQTEQNCSQDPANAVARDSQDRSRSYALVAGIAADTLPILTAEQEAAVAAITGGQGVFLLHGITGSGKTEVYLRALAANIARGRGGIVLVPEIALTPQMVSRFAVRFPGRVAMLHSGLTATERHHEWQRIRAGAVDVVIGSRSAIFAPLPNIGLIVLDEEHESAYKQDERHPTYHARDVARRLGELIGAVVVLGSATPSLESYYYAQSGRYTLLRLTTRPTTGLPPLGKKEFTSPECVAAYANRSIGTALPSWPSSANLARGAFADSNRDDMIPPAICPIQRFAHLTNDLSDGRLAETVTADALSLPGPGHSDLPPVMIVDLRAELRAGNTSILSRQLRAALDETLRRGQQAILFLNRRGAASCVLCRECGYVVRCDRCDVPMTYHLERLALLCHYCGRQKPTPHICPACQRPGIRYFGLGTQKVEQTIARVYPHARLLRWDHDTARGRRHHEQILEAFSAHRADILIGTQIIAKGLDIPGVTLVGVISADIALFLPDIRATERAFQLLTQVAGRAGRGQDPGQVIIQTFNPEHFSIRAAAAHDYLAFYRTEIAARRRFGYPPFRRFIKFTYSHKDRYQAQIEATALYDRLNRLIASLELANTDLVGPAPAFVERLRGKYRWQIIVRGPAPQILLQSLDPADLPLGWSVDVDPLSTL